MIYVRGLRFFVSACVLASALGVSGCGSWFENAPKKTVKTTKVKKTVEKVDASNYIENLALARMELAQRPADIAGLAPRLTVLKNYMAQTKAGDQTVTVLALDYTVKGKEEKHSVLVPVRLAKRDFPALTKVMGHLSALPYSMQNIRVLNTQPNPDATFSMSEEPLGLKGSLEAQQKKLMAQYGKLSAGDEIMTELALLEYFTEHRHQDAAYLMLENVKRMLATTTQQKQMDEESLTILSAKLQQMESQLKTQMPYTF